MCNNYTAAAAGKRRGNVIAQLGSACCLCPRAEMTSASSNRSLALSRTTKPQAGGPANIFDRTTAASSGLMSVPGAHPIVRSRCIRCYYGGGGVYSPTRTHISHPANARLCVVEWPMLETDAAMVTARDWKELRFSSGVLCSTNSTLPWLKVMQMWCVVSIWCCFVENRLKTAPFFESSPQDADAVWRPSRRPSSAK